MNERHMPSRTPTDPQPNYGRNMVQEPSRQPGMSTGELPSHTPTDKLPSYVTEKTSQPPSRTP